jgi:hypothetical protein
MLDTEKAWESHTKDLLALAWCLFNEPLHLARYQFECALKEKFDLPGEE